MGCCGSSAKEADAAATQPVHATVPLFSPPPLPHAQEKKAALSSSAVPSDFGNAPPRVQTAQPQGGRDVGSVFAVPSSPLACQTPTTPSGVLSFSKCGCKVLSKEGRQCTGRCGCRAAGNRCAPGRCSCDPELCGNDALGQPDLQSPTRQRTPKPPPTPPPPTAKRKFCLRIDGCQDAELASPPGLSGAPPPLLSLLTHLLRQDNIKVLLDKVQLQHGGDYGLRRTDARVQHAAAVAGPALQVDHVWECQLAAHALVQAAQDAPEWREVLRSITLPPPRPSPKEAEAASKGKPPRWYYNQCQLKKYREATQQALMPLFDVQNGGEAFRCFNLRLLDGKTNRKKGQLFDYWLAEEYKAGCDAPPPMDLRRQLSGYLLKEDLDGKAVAASGQEAGTIADNILSTFESTAETYITVVENGLDARAVWHTGLVGGPQRAERRHVALAESMTAIKLRALGKE